MSEVDDLRAENEQLRLALAAAQRPIPALPTEHDGEPITWRPWEPSPVILCFKAGDLNICPQCDHPGPSLLALGLAGPGRPVIRFNARRCPGCQEMAVYERRHHQYRIGAELVEIAYHPPHTGPFPTPREAS